MGSARFWDSEYAETSLALRHLFIKGAFMLVLSEHTLRELQGAPDAVRARLLEIPEAHQIVLADTPEADALADAYLALGILGPVISNTELIPEEVRTKIKKWSDYIDYWAVDWDFRHDTFMQGWVTYRTRKDRTLALTSDPCTYERPGRYQVLVKVVDIFGNDTTQGYDVEVKT